MKKLGTWVATAVLVALVGAANSAPVFQGRLADNTASATCTASGPDKCTSFYLSDSGDSSFQGFTILNNWNIGQGVWDDGAAPGTAQAIAAAAGLAATGLAGWVLPTGDGTQAAGPRNQFLAIMNAVGGSLSGLQAQFNDVQSFYYWSGTEYSSPLFAWTFRSVDGNQSLSSKGSPLYAVAVRPGDVSAAVPEPQTLALALLALGATVVARRRRSR